MGNWRILFLNPAPLYVHGLAAGLRQMGHEVVVFEPSKTPPHLHGDVVGRLIELYDFDLAISIGHLKFFMNAEAVLAEIVRRRIYHVYWATEDRTFHERISLPWAGRAQAVMTIDQDCLGAYRALGLPAEFMPFACNPAIHCRRPPDPRFRHDLALIAHNTLAPAGSHRPGCLLNLLLPFLEGGYDLAVWGCGWEKPFAGDFKLPRSLYHGVLSYEDSIRAASSARIVLGPQWEEESPTQVSCRTFETLGAGAFLLTSDVPGIQRFFIPGAHLEVTHSPACTKNIVDKYLGDNGARQIIAAQGQAKAYAEHTYLHRAQQLIAFVESRLGGDSAV